MKKRFLNLFMMAITIVGLSMSVTSCKDDDDEKEGGNGDNSEQTTDAAYEARDEFWNVVSQLVDPDDVTDDYLDKTFEPTIGEVSESNGLVRIVAVNDLATAAEMFAHLVDANVDENTPSYDYSNPAVGTLKYTRSDDGQSLATVDVDIKQLPSLQQIKFMLPEQAGDNGIFGFSGSAYYRFGDVITRLNSDGNPEYWVCVRPAFSIEGKSGSYWASLSPLPKEKIHTYTNKGNTWKVPTALGNDINQIQNFAELLYAVMDSQDWYQNLKGDTPPKFFVDFKVKNIEYHNQYFFNRVNYAWRTVTVQNPQTGKTNDVFSTLFNKKGLEVWRQIFENNGMHLLYKGYSWWEKISWNCTLFDVTIRNGNNDKSNFHNLAKAEPKTNMENVSFDVTSDYTYQNMPLVNMSFFGDESPRWIIRVAKGKELAANGKEDVKKPLQGWEEVYRYNDYFYDTAYDLSKQPEQFNKGKESNIGKLLDASGRLFASYTELMNGSRDKLPLAMVIYDSHDLNVEGEAAAAYDIGQRLTTQENLLCISLIPSVNPLAWGNNCNCIKSADYIDQDVAGGFEKLTKDYKGLSYTNTLIANNTDNHKHPAATACRNYDTEIYPGYNLGVIKNVSHSDWFLPSAGHWTLFLRGMHAWQYSYDGKKVQERISEVYERAGLNKTIEIGGSNYSPEQLNPFGKNLWSSSSYSADEAYILNMSVGNGAVFSNISKAAQCEVYPFVFVQERKK